MVTWTIFYNFSRSYLISYQNKLAGLSQVAFAFCLMEVTNSGQRTNLQHY